MWRYVTIQRKTIYQLPGESGEADIVRCQRRRCNGDKCNSGACEAPLSSVLRCKVDEKNCGGEPW